jgi:hypothetical protein
MEVRTDIMQAAMAKAVLEQITPELQKELFLSAVKTALFEVKDNNGYGPKQTVLERECAEALKIVTREIVLNMLRQPALHQLIEMEVKKGVDAVVSAGTIAEDVTTRLKRAFGVI